MKVSEMRERNLVNLAKRSDAYETDPKGTESAARKAMNSFYRLAGFSERKFYIENDERLYFRYLKRLPEMEKREETWIARVNKYLEPFKAKVLFNGIYPSLIDSNITPSGGVRDLYLTAWY